MITGRAGYLWMKKGVLSKFHGVKITKRMVDYTIMIASCFAFEKKNPDLVAAVLKLTDMEGYKTSGYGCIEQTDPLLAMAMGLQRDSSLKTPKLLAEKTIEVFNEFN